MFVGYDVDNTVLVVACGIVVVVVVAIVVDDVVAIVVVDVVVVRLVVVGTDDHPHLNHRHFLRLDVVARTVGQPQQHVVGTWRDRWGESLYYLLPCCVQEGKRKKGKEVRKR